MTEPALMGHIAAARIQVGLANQLANHTPRTPREQDFSQVFYARKRL